MANRRNALRKQNQSDRRGRRAEDIASWYFRLNGFPTIPGFVVHPDQHRRFPRTEADIIGVRFPFSREFISTRQMVDDPLLTSIDRAGRRTVFVLVEAKADLCDINGPWSDRRDENVHRVICRLGFSDESLVNDISSQVYDSARWENDHYVLQYVCVGARKNDGRQRKFSDLLQIDWSEIARFLWGRFGNFPEKLPDGWPIHAQWPDFGRKYGEWFAGEFARCRGDDHDRQGPSLSLSALSRYIETGNCSERKSA
jgi:hypothetical protein